LSILGGALLAYIFYPVHQAVLKRVNRGGLSAILISISVFLLFVIPGVFLVKALIQESYSLFLLGKARLAEGIFQNCNNSFCSFIKNFDSQLQEGLKLVTSFIIQKGSSIIVSVPKIILNLFVIFFTMFYFLKDGKTFLNRVGDFLSIKERKYLFIINRLKDIIHGLVYGYLLVAVIQGILGGLGFLIFGVPSPLFWGVVMAFLALIPSLGTGLIWFPAALILFLDGIFQDSAGLIVRGVLLFVYSLVIVSTIDNILKPKLVSKKAKIHPAIIMSGIFGGLLVFGALGVIIGPLILSLTTVFIDVFLTPKSGNGS